MPCTTLDWRMMYRAHQSIEDAEMTRQFSYTAVFEPAEEGGFVVTFPAIPGLATHGETLDEAGAMAEDCLRVYLESLAIDGEPAPYEAPELPPIRRITVAVAAE
jgi:antitoxin HicB